MMDRRQLANPLPTAPLTLPMRGVGDTPDPASVGDISQLYPG